MQIIETAEMRTFRLAMQDTLRQQAETILSMQARIEALQAELQDAREQRNRQWRRVTSLCHTLRRTKCPRNTPPALGPSKNTAV